MAIDVYKFKININNIRVENLNPSYQYTGKEIRPDIKVSYYGTLLKLNTDYKLSFKDNINSSNVSHLNATVIIEGIGCYKGKVNKYFTIVPAQIEYNLDGYSELRDVLSGTAERPEVQWRNKATKENKDYIVKYKDFKYKFAEDDKYVYVMASGKIEYIGIGNYTGSLELFTDYCEVMSISKEAFNDLRHDNHWNYEFLNKQLNGELDKYIPDISNATVNFGVTVTVPSKNETLPFSIILIHPKSNYKYHLIPEIDYTYIKNGKQYILHGIGYYKGSLTITVN